MQVYKCTASNGENGHCCWYKFPNHCPARRKINSQSLEKTRKSGLVRKSLGPINHLPWPTLSPDWISMLMSMSIFFVGHHISHYVGYHIGHLVCIHVGHNVRLHVDFFLATNRKLVTRLLVEYIVLPRRNIVCAYWCNAVWQPSVFHQNAQIIDPLIFIILFCFLLLSTRY